MNENFKETLEQFAYIDTNVGLNKLTTLRIGGVADYVAYPENSLGLDGLVRYLHKEAIPYKVIGKGSNLLCSDAPYHGVIIRMDRLNDTFVVDNVVTAQAGVSIIALAHQAASLSLSGLEFAGGIPASVGGTTFMNAGAYKSCVADIIDSVFVYRNSKFEWMHKEECAFSYRYSIFQQHPDWIIVAVKYVLSHGNQKEIKELMESRRIRRMNSQPLDYPSAGSVFRNPHTVPAWQLIEGIGYRGKCIGQAKVSEKHVNFIVNNGQAKADDFLQLVNEIKEKVDQQYGIELHTEVELFNWHNQ